MRLSKAVLFTSNCLLLCAVALPGLEAAQSEAGGPGIFHLLFVDMSISGRGQEAQWQSAAEVMVFSRFRAGDAIWILGLHDHTGESAALFQCETPALDPRAGRDATMDARRRLAAALAGGREAVRRVLQADVRAKETRIVESLRRSPLPVGRRLKIYYLSDMLESTKILDLERMRLTAQNTPALIESAMRAFHIGKGLLGGAAVYCVLDSPRIGQAANSPNPRAALEAFWRGLFEEAGARLEWFDSTPNANGR